MILAEFLPYLYNEIDDALAKKEQVGWGVACMESSGVTRAGGLLPLFKQPALLP